MNTGEIPFYQNQVRRRVGRKSGMLEFPNYSRKSRFMTIYRLTESITCQVFDAKNLTFELKN